MKTKRISELSEKLPKTYRNAIFETIDTKVENDMDKVLNKLDNMENAFRSKYNVLIGMISFLGFILTAITVIIGFFQ